MIKFSAKARFTLLLFAVVALIFYLTLELGRVARLVPLRVVIPTLGLLLLQLLLDLVPRLPRPHNSFELVRLYRTEWIREKLRTSFTVNPVREKPQTTELSTFAWLMIMLALVCFLGFLIAVPLYTLLYLRGRSGEGWTLSLAVVGVASSLSFAVFHLALHIHLYEGQLWGWLGL